MSTETEEVLEKKLVDQLHSTLGYDHVLINDEGDLIANLKTQLEKHKGA